MPKRKKKSKGSTGRRRISGIGGGPMMDKLMMVVVAGAAATIEQFAAEKLDKSKNASSPVNLDPKMVGGLALVVGGFLATNKSPMIAAAGTGLAVGACITLAKGFGVLSGVNDIPILIQRPAGRTGDMSMLNGTGKGGRVSGAYRDPSLSVISGTGGTYGGIYTGDRFSGMR